jgi:F0F1-type ATP synthase membrane subunit c/vacuolar-type H+-ATPase subunit K
MAPRTDTPRGSRTAQATAKRKAAEAAAEPIDDRERQLVGQIFCGVLALFGVLVAVISILVSLYADAEGGTVEAYVLWGLIVTTTLAIVLSSITAGGALARMTGHDVPRNNIEGMVYVILVLITTCVLIVVVFGLRYF